MQEIKRKYTVERKNYTVAVDLGSSNVVVAVGEKVAEGRMDVASIVSKPSRASMRARSRISNW